MSTTPTRLLVVGATGDIGARVVRTAQRLGIPTRALVRDARRGGRLLPGTELAVGDLERPETLTAALDQVGAVVLAHGGPGDPDSARRVDYGGVAAVLTALAGRTPRVVLMTSIGVTRQGPGPTGELLAWKRRGERLVRASGCPWTVVRPGWFDATGPDDQRVVLAQGDTGDGGVARDQVAEVLVRCALSDAAIGRTFELFAEPGPTTTDWDGLFTAVPADHPGSLDAVADPATLPTPEQEPDTVRDDLARLTHR